MKQLTFIFFIFTFFFSNPLEGQHYLSMGLDNMYLNDEYRTYTPLDEPDFEPTLYYVKRFNEQYVFSGIELGYHFNTKKNIYFRFNTSLYWKAYAKDKIETFSNFIHANKIKMQSGKYIRIKKHRLGLGGEFYAFASKELDPNYGFGPILDYSIPLKDNMNIRFYGSYAYDLAHVCLYCEESLPRSFAYHFGILLDMDFAKKAE